VTKAMHLQRQSTVTAPSASRAPLRTAARPLPHPQPLGNQAFHSLLLTRAIRAKLTVNQPGDAYEQEADRVADQVMRMSDPAATGSPPGGSHGDLVQLKCAHCEEALQRRIEPNEDPDEESADAPVYDDPAPNEGGPEGEEDEGGSELAEESGGEMVQEEREEGGVQLKALASPTPQPNQAFASHLTSRRGGGRPLETGVRLFMESRFGADFSAVRVHSDSGATQMTRQVRAAAFTHGRDVYFGSGQYSPDTNTGRRLLAHELTHVLQQNGGPATGAVQRTPVSVSTGATPAIQRRMEVDVNLQTPHRVRVATDTGTTRVFNPVSGGPRTLRLVGRVFTLSKRSNPTARDGKWGLQYFCPFNGGIGYHSNIAYPTMRTLCADRSRMCDRSVPQGSRVRLKLLVDGTARSHGCIRLRHANAREFYGMVRSGIRVRVYRESNWQPPSWRTT
jgi:uncharacterized protein DUF4157/L,D-transpeptidase-like protein